MGAKKNHANEFKAKVVLAALRVALLQAVSFCRITRHDGDLTKRRGIDERQSLAI